MNPRKHDSEYSRMAQLEKERYEIRSENKLSFRNFISNK